MLDLKPPKIHKKVACIAKDPVLAAIVTTYFNTEGSYFCLMDAPRIKRPNKSNEVIKRNNVLARVQPEIIIYAGLNKEEINELNKIVPTPRVIIINDDSEIKSKLNSKADILEDAVFKCRKEDIVPGLIRAKKLRKRLEIDEASPAVDVDLESTNQHVVVIDDDDLLAQVMAANFAISVGAELRIIAAPDKEFVNVINRDLLDTRNSTPGRSTDATRSTQDNKTKLIRSLGNINFENTEFITYITKGIPYGYFFPEIPATHYYSYPDLGLSLFYGIYVATKIKQTRTAVLVDPGFFTNSETSLVKSVLENGNTYVKTISGDDATVYNVSQYIQFFPYDLLFFCSHAGEAEGEKLTIRVKDRSGIPHIIEIEQAVGFSFTGEGTGMQSIVSVSNFIGFVSFDGVVWEKAKTPPFFVSDFMKLEGNNKWDILHREPCSVNHCVVVKLKDSLLQFHFHLLAEHTHPLVFNNSCNSSHEMAGSLLFAGAYAYIGTLTTVGDSDAINIAKEVFTNISKTKTLPIVLWEAQRKVYPSPEDRIYIHFGSPFSNVYPTIREIKLGLMAKMQQALTTYAEKIQRNDLSKDVRRNLSYGYKFIEKQLKELLASELAKLPPKELENLKEMLENAEKTQNKKE